MLHWAIVSLIPGKCRTGKVCVCSCAPVSTQPWGAARRTDGFLVQPWTLLTHLLWFAEKVAFVGFKGSFRPVWVKLVTNEDSAKIYQALPIPVVKKMKLWGHAALPSGCQHCPMGWTTDCSPPAPGRPRHRCSILLFLLLFKEKSHCK